MYEHKGLEDIFFIMLYGGAALLALAGDVGGTLGPSLVGLCTKSSENDIQSGLLAASVFPVLLVVCLLCLRSGKAKKETAQ